MGGNVAIVKIEGPLDSNTSPDFEDYISQLNQRHIHFILFDALKLDYISSEGIGLILFIQKKISENNGFFVIFNLPDEIRALYEVLGFEKIFRIAYDQAEAMQIMDRQIELRKHSRHENQFNSMNLQDITENGSQGFFPFVIECAHCQALVRIKKSGDYLCPECKTEFTIMQDQTVVF